MINQILSQILNGKLLELILAIGVMVFVSIIVNLKEEHKLLKPLNSSRDL